jgi:copper(I)-binding protein
MKIKALLLTLLTISPFASACANITSDGVYARATPPSAATSAMFGHFMNSSDTDRYIVSAETEAAGKVELHNMIMEGDLMKMRQVEKIKIPAKGSVELKPGSLHIMLFNLKKPLTENNKIPVKMTFANGETQNLKVQIKKVHSEMKHEHHH